jgi:hypothetical protein
MDYVAVAKVVLTVVGSAIGLGALGYSLWRIKQSYDKGVRSEQKLESVVEGVDAANREAQEVARRRGRSAEEENEILGEES